jgi:hypothetical protein
MINHNEMSREEYWEECLKKGEIGESCIDAILKDRGFVAYSPPEGSHPIDRFYLHTKTFKTIIVDVKTKSKRKLYPDTGFDLKDYEKYLQIYKNTGIKVLIIFIDQDMREIYGNTIDKLSEEVNIGGVHYPKIEGSYDGQKLIYFSIDSFKKIKKF